MKKAFSWSAPVVALVAVLAFSLPGSAAASGASSVPQSPYPTLKGATLHGVLAVSARNVWAVGGNADSTALILHWNGKSWS